jgi:hypothetical protein
VQYFLLILLTVGNDQALCYHCFILSLIFVHVYFLLLEFNNGDHQKKKDIPICMDNYYSENNQYTTRNIQDITTIIDPLYNGITVSSQE